MNSVKIVKTTVADVPAIRNIAMATWPVTYSAILSAAQIEYMLGTIYKASEIEAQIKDGSQEYLLAYLDDKAIGFAAFGPQPEANTYKLFKLYILPDIQKSGAGKALLNEVENSSLKAGAKRIILNVHRSNPARSYYEKNGFHIYETKDIPFGPGFVLNDYLMEKTLRPVGTAGQTD